MNDQPIDERHEDEMDTGEPIRELAGFEQQTSTGLLSRIRRSIQRRSMISQLTTFSASVPLLVVREFWLILIEQFGPKSPEKDV